MVIVFGSVNLDLSVPVPHAPRAGETVLGGALLVDGGGKGANQAHAARRYGARVVLAGAVGEDALGTTALANLERAGVDLGALRRISGMATGTALITLDVDGENRIVVAPGANAQASADSVTDADLARAKVLLLQLEVPFEQSRQLARRARAHGCRVILNAAPVLPGWRPDLADIDVVIVNRIELHQLADSLGVAAGAPAARAQALASAHGCEVLQTLGAHGAMLAAPDGGGASMNGHALPVIDTTGAGDTFAGVFAAAWAEGQDRAGALRAANAAAALSCGARGAQAAQPERIVVENFLRAGAH